jgi:hypothetical protein
MFDGFTEFDLAIEEGSIHDAEADTARRSCCSTASRKPT